MAAAAGRPGSGSGGGLSASQLADMQAIKERQARWMRERQAEADSQAVAAELQAEDRYFAVTGPVGGGTAAARGGPADAGAPPAGAAGGSGRPGGPPGDAAAGPSGYNAVAYAPSGGHIGGSGGGRTAASLPDSRLVNRLTERITDRLREELMVELKREGLAAAASDAAAAAAAPREAEARLEGYLAKEIASHTCPICYELMVPPEHSPMLLFPCGHSFCAACLEQQARTHGAAGRNRCPYCRKPIESRALNISLQQLTTSYAARRDRPGAGGGAGGADGGPGAAAATASPARRSEGEGAPAEDAVASTPQELADMYGRTLRTVDMRCRILRNELLDTRAELAAIGGRRGTALAVLGALRADEGALRQQIRDLQDELRVAASQTAEQEGRLEAVEREAADGAARAALIEATLGPLEAEAEKLQLLLEALPGIDALPLGPPPPAHGPGGYLGSGG